MNNLDITAAHDQAEEKLTNELKSFKGDQKATIVSSFVADILKKFCRQDESFAEAVVREHRTLSDCCCEIMKGTGNGPSDFEVYSKATKFYFPTAEVEFAMHIHLEGQKADGTGKEKPGGICINLDDFM